VAGALDKITAFESITANKKGSFRFLKSENESISDLLRLKQLCNGVPVEWVLYEAVKCVRRKDKS
jgi:hypothetical protein